MDHAASDDERAVLGPLGLLCARQPVNSSSWTDPIPAAGQDGCLACRVMLRRAVCAVG